MTKWKVKGWIRGALITLGTFSNLSDALDCVVMLGKGTKKKFRIYKIEERFYDGFTAKEAEKAKEILK